jgi:mannitol 2-dehydrogenase
VPDTVIPDYYKLIVERFSNPEIADTERRLCLDGSNRQPKFIVPSVRDALAAGGSINGLALVSALWCRYCAGTEDDGTVIPPNDPNWDKLQPLALAAKDNPKAWLEGLVTVYGDVATDLRFVEAFSRWLPRLWKDGTAATLMAYIDGKA